MKASFLFLFSKDRKSYLRRITACDKIKTINKEVTFMPRFFINESPSRQAIITGEDSKHITKSLRMKVGESLVLCNGQGMDYHCTISSMDEHQVVVSVNSSVPTISEPSVSVTLYQGASQI